MLKSIIKSITLFALSSIIISSNAFGKPQNNNDYSLTPHPAKSNNFSCAPSSEHPRPVILVHGYTGSSLDFESLASNLTKHKFCVYTLNYGRSNNSVLNSNLMFGFGDIRNSARNLGNFVDTVIARTAAKQVDLIGHSEGGAVIKRYLRFNGGVNRDDIRKNKVNKVITFAGNHHGSTPYGLDLLAKNIFPILRPFAGAIDINIGIVHIQSLAGSEFFEETNKLGDTDPGINYTIIASRFDKVIFPSSSTFLKPGREATVNNIWLQTDCKKNKTNHASLPKDKWTQILTLHALDPTIPLRLPAYCY